MDWTEGHSPNDIVQGLKSRNLETKENMARVASNILSSLKKYTPTLMSAGVLQPLLAALPLKDCHELRVKVLKCLLPICQYSYEYKMELVNKGGIAALNALMVDRLAQAQEYSNLSCNTYLSHELVFTALSILQEIAVTHPDLRTEVLLKTNAVILSYIEISLIRPTCLNFYINICKKRDNQPTVELSLVNPVLPIVVDILREDIGGYYSVFVDISSLYSVILYLSEEESYIEELQAVPGLLWVITRAMAAPKKRIADEMLTSCQVICNMMRGTPAQRDRCMNAGCMNHIITHLSSKKDLAEVAVEMIYIVLEENSKWVRHALDQKQNILDLLFQQLTENCTLSPSGRTKVLQCIKNLLSFGGDQVCQELVSRHLPAYSMMLRGERPSGDLVLVLGGLDVMLEATANKGTRVLNALCIELETLGVVDQIDALQHHEDDQVYLRNTQLIDAYFNMEVASF